MPFTVLECVNKDIIYILLYKYNQLLLFVFYLIVKVVNNLELCRTHVILTISTCQAG